MTDPHSREGVSEAGDERAVARKYGLRELIYPDSEQVKLLTEYLGRAVESRRSGPLPKTAVVVMLEFLQGTMNRQNITKSPMMSAAEFDLLQAPYYLVTRILARLGRERQDAAAARGTMYQAASLSISTFLELLRSLLDPGCSWLRQGTIPDGVIETMGSLRAFAATLPEQRRKGRAF